jgi:DNA mismatch endonuclease, patch repair protein
MSAIRSAENRVERALRSQLHRYGVRFRKYYPIPGRPDIVFPRLKTAVFVDGDFWHGREIIENGIASLRKRLKTPNRLYWVTKLRRNIDRDVIVTLELKQRGWHVLRFWESDVEKDIKGVALKVIAVLNRRRKSIKP